MREKNWYLRLESENKVFGPFSKQELVAFHRQGKLSREHVVSKDHKHWVGALQILSSFEETRRLRAPQQPISGHSHSSFVKTKKLSLPLDNQVGHYRILGELGRGGMGIVYKAEDLKLNRVCALKVIHHQQLTNSRSVERFIEEARSIGHLKHRNIVTIHEIITTPIHMFAMEYVAGQTLQKYLLADDFDIQRFMQIILEVCAALEYAHERQVIHRDLKPENIMITTEGHAKVMDFGIARRLDAEKTLSKTDEIVGTPAYMAIELLNGGKADQRSDIYAVGVMIYEALTGSKPFVGKTPVQIFFQMARKDPTPPSKLHPKTNKDLEAVCLKCLEKSPEKRFQTVRPLRDEIERFLNNKPVLTHSPGIVSKTRKWCERNPVAAGLCLLMFISIIMTIYLLASHARELEDSNNQLQTAEQATKKALQEKKRALVKSQQKLALAHMKMSEYHIATRFYTKAQKDLLAAKNIFGASPGQSKHLNDIAMALNYTTTPILPRLAKKIPFEAKDFDFSSNGQYFLLYRKKQLFVWNTSVLIRDEENFSSPQQIVPIGSSIFSITNDGQNVAYAVRNEVRIYNLARKKVEKKFSFGGRIKFLTFSPNGRFMGVSVIRSRTSFENMIVDLQQDKQFLFDEVRRESLANITFSHDSSRALCRLHIGIQVMNLNDKKVNSLWYAGNPVAGAAFTPNKRVFVYDKAGNILVWNAASKAKQQDILFAAHPNKHINHVVFSQDRRFFATVAEGREVVLWDMMTRGKILSFTVDSPIYEIRFDRNNRHLQMVCVKEKLYYYCWKIEPNLQKQLFVSKKIAQQFDELQKFITHANSFSSGGIAFSPSKRYVAMPILTHLLMWDLQKSTFSHIAASVMYQELLKITFSPQEKTVAYSFNKNHVEWQNLETGEITSLSLPRRSHGLIFWNENVLLFNSDKQLFAYDMVAEKYILQKPYYNRVLRALEISHDRKWIALIRENVVHIFDHEKILDKNYEGTVVPMNFRGHFCAWSKNSKRFSISDAKEVAIFDRVEERWELVKYIRSPFDIVRVSLSPDGKYMCVFGRNQMFIEHLESGTRKPVWTGYFLGTSASLDCDWKYLAIPSIQRGVVLYNFPYGRDTSFY
ncbi:WD40 repeat domain-containing serine/threonine protein kinase [Candidatus Uabimicrobium amorphum]|uniref:non-specific serine/threonine protein kinase n=1 Tax=Uabimicrobium amorphum TaxID=2596890 RepID=A0A5S9IMH8_UABAM|nr:WD40 repeat domain-containing serine/threonine protein kinase [Candidatus Uabimicrobium amorphum]BBM83295.1 protein kinase [Candidatus Uabimicrobium amorphum]